MISTKIPNNPAIAEIEQIQRRMAARKQRLQDAGYAAWSLSEQISQARGYGSTKEESTKARSGGVLTEPVLAGGTPVKKLEPSWREAELIYARLRAKTINEDAIDQARLDQLSGKKKMRLADYRMALGLSPAVFAKEVSQFSGVTVSHDLIINAEHHETSQHPKIPMAAPKAIAISKFLTHEFGRPISVADIDGIVTV